MNRLLRRFLLISLFAALSATAQAQQFARQQAGQERTIKAAKRAGRITGLEYDKLMREQGIIREAMRKAAADGVWTAREKNAVHDKLQRAGRRLRRYQHNAEVY